MRKPWHFLPYRWLAAVGARQREQPARRRETAAFARLHGLASSLSATCLQDIETLEDWQRQRPKLQRQLAWMLGLEPLPKRTPLAPRVTGRLEHEDCRVEKVVFESLPGLLVTANLYLPNRVSDPLPCVVYLCGHLLHPLGAKVPYQDRCWWYAQNGFACLVLDPLELGEVAGVHHGTFCHNYWHWASLGYTPAGVEVWNAMRALDWLETRPEVDSHRIGVTGISGGGVMSWFLAALDERVAAAAPTCATYTIGTQVTKNLLRFQCDCVFYPNVFAMDFPSVAALVAPRPVLILNGKKDPIFPPAGYAEVYARVRRVYALYGQSDQIAMVESKGGHDDTPLTLMESRAWMQRWLGQKCGTGTSGERGKALPPERLACLEALPVRAANYSIDRDFVPLAHPTVPPSPAVWQARREELMQQLRQRVFGWLPVGRSSGWCSESRPYQDANLLRYGQAEESCLETEPGVKVRTILVLPRDSGAQEAPLVVLVRRFSGSRYQLGYYDLLPLLGRATAVLVYPRFSELPLSPGEFTDLQRTAMLLGRTVAAMQVWDVMCAVRWAIQERRLGGGRATVVGRGEDAITALYAGLFEDSAEHIVLEDPPASHWQGPPLPGILRVTDLPEVAGFLAPRRLTLVRASHSAFALTRRHYELVGAASALRTAESLPEAVFAVGGSSANSQEEQGHEKC